MRVLFAGSPEISSVLLKYLLDNQSEKYQIVGVLTNPPSAQKRKSTLIPTPVEQVAREYNEYALQSNKQLLKILTPEKLDASVRDEVATLTPDILLCFAYGKIFGPKFMALFNKGGINVHPSLLPKFRGCAPVPQAILAMEEQTGITIQTLAQEMDCGDILEQKVIKLDGTETTDSLLEFCAKESCLLVAGVLEKIACGTQLSKPQEGEPSYCAMLKKEDGLIHWNKSSKQIDAQIRAFYSWPGAFTSCGENILRIHSAKIYAPENYDDIINENDVPGTVLKADKQNGILVKTGDGILQLLNLQWQTKKAMSWKDFINGTKNFAGSVLK